ncbi:unnamed protein product [Parnassius mnemosyne]|uniref:Small ribosomal subunit protein mS31 n=1 Tax=Parnassius mnemosyne TaxID=213953 RepID=A0AAV1M7J0_9NEOP
MLTRLRLKRDFKLFVRCLSEKPPESEGNSINLQTKDQEEQKKNAKDTQTEKIQALLKSMMTAPKINESEYRQKFATAPEIPRKRKQKTDGIEETTQNIEQNLTKAAEEVAQAMGGDVKQTEAELLSRVLGKINQTSTNLSDLLIGMKVDRSKDADDVINKETRGQQVKRLVEKSQSEAPKPRYIQRKQKAATDRQPVKKSLPASAVVNVFSGEPLGIFKPKEVNYGTKLEMWETLNQRELNLATLQPPANYFQKMILWTEQGKVWKFPINNEQGLEEEKNVHFSEHIFLDTHLEGWCPTRGPIRHFMELVCVGLSKNPFYTVQEKKDHIMWYKEYFESKKDLLTEVGAWDAKPVDQEASA